MGLKQQSFLNGPLVKPALKILLASIKIPHPALYVCWCVCALVFQFFLCVFLCVSLWLFSCVWFSCCAFLLWNNLHLFHSIHPSNPLIICLSFHPHTIITSITQIFLLSRSRSHHHAVSLSACGCCGLCWCFEQRFEIVAVQPEYSVSKTNIFWSPHAATCYWSKSNWTLNINPHQSGRLNTQAAETQKSFVKS